MKSPFLIPSSRGTSKRVYAALLAAVTSLTAISTLHAQSTLYWDPNGAGAAAGGTSGITGGNGAWDAATTSDWYAGTGNSDTTWLNDGSATAYFLNLTGSTQTATLAGTVSVNGLTFDHSTTAITGGTLNLTSTTGTSNIVLVSPATSGTITGYGSNASIASNITGSSALELSSAGGFFSTLTLSGSNSYSGGTFLNGKGIVVSAGNNAAFGTAAITVNGSYDEIHGSATIANNIVLNTTLYSLQGVTVTGTISGAGGIRADGSDATLTGNNTYSGGTELTSGATLRVKSSNTALGTGAVTVDSGTGSTLATQSASTAVTLANNVTLSSGANLKVDSGYAPITLTGVISGSGNFATASSGTTTLTGSNTYLGTTTVGANTLLVNGDQSAATGAVTTGSGGILGGIGKLGGATTVNIGGKITGGGIGTIGTLTIGALTLSGTYVLDLNSTANLSDKLVSTGALSLGGNLAVTDLSAGTPTSNLIIAQGTSLSGSFVGLAQGASVDGGLYTIDYGILNANAVTLIAVPEPSTFVLAGIFGAGMLMLFRRRSVRR